LFYGLGYAGTAGMVWGWLIAMVFIQCVAMSMAEICSSMPTSGGLYYAAAVLAPEGWGPLAAWITGWSNYLAQVTGAPSVDYALASMILGARSMTNTDYTPTEWEVFLLSVFIMIVHACISLDANALDCPFQFTRYICQHTISSHCRHHCARYRQRHAQVQRLISGVGYYQ